jgi:hypothetical protein
MAVKSHRIYGVLRGAESGRTKVSRLFGDRIIDGKIARKQRDKTIILRHRISIAKFSDKPKPIAYGVTLIDRKTGEVLDEERWRDCSGMGVVAAVNWSVKRELERIERKYGRCDVFLDVERADLLAEGIWK